MKRSFLLTLLMLTISIYLYAQSTTNDTSTRQKFIHAQTVKAETLNMMALQLATPGAGSKNLNQAIEYIMKGLHIYSRFRDSIGLRQSFDHLGLVYHLQKKYVQAKWFYIQSNSLSRELKDTANIINSLIALSSVKTDIKDFAMADADLNEAFSLAKSKPDINRQIEVEQARAEYYTKNGDAKRAEQALNRIIFLKDSVSKLSEAVRLAKLKQKDAEQLALKQKQALLQKDESKLQTLIRQKNAITIIIIVLVTIVATLLIALYLKKKQKA